jgi:hypothetical protein
MDAGAVVAAQPQPARSADGRYQLNRLANGTIIISCDEPQQLVKVVASTSAVFTPDGSGLYSATAGDILAMGLSTGAICEIIKPGYQSYASHNPEPVRSLAVDRTGRYLAVGGEEALTGSGSWPVPFSHTDPAD